MGEFNQEKDALSRVATKLFQDERFQLRVLEALANDQTDEEIIDALLEEQSGGGYTLTP